MTTELTRAPLFDRDAIAFGVTPTLWWNDDFLDLDAGITFGQAVSEMALAGFEGCSIGHKYPTDTDVLRAELGRRRLRVSEPWTSTFFTVEAMHDRTVADFRRSLEFIRSMGGSDLVVAELGMGDQQSFHSARAQPPGQPQHGEAAGRIGPTISSCGHLQNSSRSPEVSSLDSLSR